MFSLNIPYLSLDEIRNQSDCFLHDNSIDAIPVEIEKVVEFNYGIDIIPFPDLQKTFRTEGFSAKDFTEIYVDQFVYENRFYRYRFTLAHEIAHLILHKSYLESCTIKTLDGWIKFIRELDPRDHDKIEFQAYTFAGLVLVPDRFLHQRFNDHLVEIEDLIDQAKSSGLVKADYLDYAIDKLADLLSPDFQVSRDVLTRRIKNTKLDLLLP
ncbi:ImmA/IrrE family metallo-endopeptidase [candidate division KSB1 bacterium]|nr:ImmA/IrrE family metallo-endopeptidase [candidate division KSB1 bacterium]